MRGGHLSALPFGSGVVRDTTYSILISHFFLGLLNLFFRLEVGSPSKVAKLIFKTPFQVLQDGPELLSECGIYCLNWLTLVPVLTFCYTCYQSLMVYIILVLLQNLCIVLPMVSLLRTDLSLTL